MSSTLKRASDRGNRARSTRSAGTRRVCQEIQRLCLTDKPPAEFGLRLLELIKRAVPYDSGLLVHMDPLTQLPVSFQVDDLPENQSKARWFFENIYFADDFSSYTDMVRNRRITARLSDVTGGDLNRALRFREFIRPGGRHFEMRAAFLDRDTLWGGLCLLRESDLPDFTEDELAFLRRITPHVTGAFRVTALRRSLATEGQLSAPLILPAQYDPALLVLDHEGRIVRSTPLAASWLQQLGGNADDAIPAPIWLAKAALNRSFTHPEQRAPALHVRTRSGEWMTVQALYSVPQEGEFGETTVLLASAKPADVSLLKQHIYGFSPREQEVAELVIRGHSTRQIGDRLFISESTVQGHLSHIFEKAGVRSRRDLLQRLFLDEVFPEQAPVPREGGVNMELPRTGGLHVRPRNEGR